jgi:hypothetical protein
MEAQKTVSRRTAWTNLIVCGGISWGVNVWHAWNTPAGHTSNIVGAHVSPTLALLYGTAPVVVGAFQSHNIAHAGGGKFKKALTFLVFALGMALSIYAQAAAVAPIAGEVLKWVFPIMLDLSAFMALHSIMTPAAAASSDASSEASLERLSEASPRRLPSVSPTPAKTLPAERPKTPKKTAGKTAAKTGQKTPADVRADARQLLKNNPNMAFADVARQVGRKPSGYMRTMCAEILNELTDAGEIDRVRAV